MFVTYNMFMALGGAIILSLCLAYYFGRRQGRKEVMDMDFEYDFEEIGNNN